MRFKIAEKAVRSDFIRIFAGVMKNIVFDLGGVVFARRRSECSEDFARFFAFVRWPKMPLFWEEYDRGTWTLDRVKEHLCEENGCPMEKCDAYIRQAIDMQRPVEPTEKLLGDLKKAGYKLYVLSNMSLEFIEFLRKFPLYDLFDGEVVSCEEHVVKPEKRIYEILLTRYALNPRETLFIDDRAKNIEAAQDLDIAGYVFDHEDPQKSCDELRGMLL